jgi:hypothetical protein
MLKVYVDVVQRINRFIYTEIRDKWTIVWQELRRLLLHV